MHKPPSPTAYRQWLHAEVQAAIDDPGPTIPHRQAMAEIRAAILNDDDGAAAKAHLAAGRFITYRVRELGNCLVREWPDGRREVIEADLDGNITVLKQL